MKLRLLLFLSLLYSAVTLAFSPSMYTFTASEYDNHQENYSAVYNNSGLLYVANAYGLLEYDGYEWNRIALPDGKSPVSLCLKDGVVYVGGNDEFGYIKYSRGAPSCYQSLASLLPTAEKNKIGWLDHCVEANGKVYFSNNEKVIVYDGQSVLVLKPTNGNSFLSLDYSMGQLFLFEKGRGIGVFENNDIEWMGSSVANLNVVNIEKVSSKLYYLYTVDGIYKFDGVHAEKIEKTNFLSTLVVTQVLAKGSKKVLCTELGGVYILDDQLDVQSHFDHSNSKLSTNFIYGVAENKEGDLCFASANGITLLNASSSLLNIDAASGLYGAGYCSLLVGDTMYLGTSQGLFFAPNWKLKGEKKFQKVANVKAYVYDIHLQNGALFCGNRAEMYQIMSDGAKVISPSTYRGAWGIHAVPGRDDVFLVGTYSGIDVYRFENKEWKFSNAIEGYTAPGRNFEFDEEGNIWVASGLAGLYKLSISKDFAKVLKSEEFCKKFAVKSDYFIELIECGKTILVSSYGGVFKVENGALVKDAAFTALGLPFERLRKINNDLIYTVQKRTPIVLRRKGSVFTLDSAHILNNVNIELIGNSEWISTSSPDEYLVGTPDGFLLSNNASLKKYYGKLTVRKIQNINTDSTVIGGNVDEIAVSYDNHDLRFTFAYSPLERFYSLDWYVLLEEDGAGEWKKVEKAHFKEFSNLREGDYTLRVKVMCRYNTLDETSVSFKVLPPWYRSSLAKVLYLLLFLLTVFLVYRFTQHRVKKVSAKMQAEKERELMVQEKEFKAELLKKELQEKETEMSYMALNYSQKKDLLEHVSDKLNELMGKLDDPRALRAEIKGLEFSLNKSEDGEERKWQEFQVLFNREHNDFLDKIKVLDPKIKESMLLMCVYIRMGKSNKDICDLINISITALDKRKSRLREKFNVAGELTLNEFLRLL